MTYAYRLAAFKVESELDLPDLPPWDESSASEPDIVIRLDSVPSQLTNADRVEPIFQTRGRDEFLLALPDTGRILIRDGRAITIDPDSAADPVNLRALLTGPVQAVLWHQRGLLPLHANAVVIGERAVALAGPSAAGKSALAAVLAQAGHKTLADDICLVEANDDKRVPVVVPGVTLLRLWRDTLDQLGLVANDFRPTLSGKDKFLVDCWAGCREPRPLAAMFILARQYSVALATQRLSGIIAMNALREVVHMHRPARALGRESDIFAGLTRLLSTGVAVWRLTLPEDPACLGDAARQVVEALEQS